MTVSYQKSFWIGDFLQHKIGIEVTVNLPNDTAEEALDRAIAFVNERNEAINPYQLPSKEEMKGTVVKPVEEPRSTANALVADINSCTELKVLESYRFIAQQNPSLTHAYDKKLKELQ